jgi:hypothetical protein
MLAAILVGSNYEYEQKILAIYENQRRDRTGIAAIIFAEKFHLLLEIAVPHSAYCYSMAFNWYVIKIFIKFKNKQRGYCIKSLILKYLSLDIM